MENCLVTKLKSVVDNSNLEILGGVLVHAVSNNSGMITLKETSNGRKVHVYAPDVTITAVGTGGRFIDSHNAEIDTTFLISEANKSFDFILTDKYNLTKFTYSNQLYTDNSKFLKAITGLTEFSIVVNNNSVRSSISFKDVPTNSLERINITSAVKYNLVFNDTINELISNVDPTKLTKCVCKLNAVIEPNTNITSLLGSFGTVTTLSFFNCTNMTGTVESLVAAQVSAERTTATITITDGGTLGNVTFNGVEFTGITGSVSTLKWRPTTSSTEGAVTDICLNSTAITITADGTKVADATPW